MNDMDNNYTKLSDMIPIIIGRVTKKLVRFLRAVDTCTTLRVVADPHDDNTIVHAVGPVVDYPYGVAQIRYAR